VAQGGLLSKSLHPLTLRTLPSEPVNEEPSRFVSILAGTPFHPLALRAKAQPVPFTVEEGGARIAVSLASAVVLSDFQ
jgi:hypothetical protein